GRSVSIGLFGCVHSAAAAGTIAASVTETRAAKRSDRLETVGAASARIINQQPGLDGRGRAERDSSILARCPPFCGARSIFARPVTLRGEPHRNMIAAQEFYSHNAAWR